MFKKTGQLCTFSGKKTTPLARNDRNDRWAAARAPEAFLIQSPVQASKRNQETTPSRTTMLKKVEQEKTVY